MKRIWKYMLAGSLFLSLAACGTKQEDAQEHNEPEESQETAQSTPAEEESILFGNDSLGWLDLGAWNDIVRGTENSADIMQVIARGKEGGLIQAETLNFSEERDYAYVCDYLRSRYTRDSFSGKEYQNKEEWELTLDGMPALKIYGEREDTKTEGKIVSCVGYITNNAAGDWIIYQLTAPKDWKDADGNDYRPTIQDLCDIVEKTFRREK